MHARCTTFLIALVLWAGLPLGASADQHAVDTLNTLFGATKVDPALFSPGFLAKIPASDVQAFIGSFEARLGAPTSIRPAGVLYVVTAPKGTIKATIAFDQSGLISSLLFQDELSSANLEALTRVLSAETISPAWFHPSYLKDVPLVKTDSVLADMHKVLGKFVRVDTNNDAYIAVFERGETHAQISTDSADRIVYLEFTKPPVPLPASPSPASPAASPPG